MKTRHTPGSWRAYNAQGNKGRILKNWRVIALDDTTICTIENRNDCDRHNAELIAAAPCMLAALEAIHAALNQPIQFTDSQTASDVLRGDAALARNLARTAIQKATGEA